MNILGISAFYHDSAACLVQDGHIVAAAQEERFTRRKHDAAFPANAVRYALDEAGIALGDVDYVTFYDKPFRSSNGCWRPTWLPRRAGSRRSAWRCRSGSAKNYF